jgi:hypothetical protein
MFPGMSDLDAWIESKGVKVLRGRLGGWAGEIVIVLATFIVALMVRRFVSDHVGDPYAGGGNLGLLWIFGAPAAAAIGLTRRRTVSQGPGTIGVVDGDLVIVQGRERKQIPLTRLVEGRSSPRRNEVDLALRGGGQIVAQVARADDAERLLVAAGLDASKRTMRFELGETTFLTWMTFLLGPSAVTPVTAAMLSHAPLSGGGAVVIYCSVFLVLFVALFKLVRAAWGPAKLIVGAEGIVIERAVRDEFVPFGSLASVTMEHNSVTLIRDDGARVRARARHLSDVQQSELKARIDAAILAFRRGENAAESLSQLDRAGRPIAAWRAALGALLEQQASYRETPLTREQLLAVLESPAAPAERRLAAAVSLSAAGDAEIAAKIRIAADACARPGVRIALTHVAEGTIDDAAIEAAIADDESSRSRKIA